MRGTAFSPGQSAELNAAITIAIATALPRAAGNFKDPKAVLRALQNRGAKLTEHMEEALRQAIGRMMTLLPLESFSITLSARHVPRDFYVDWNGQGLTYADTRRFGGFEKTVLTKAVPVEAGTVIAVDSFELGNLDGSTHDEIESVLEPDHFFDESTLCAIVAAMIATQAKGEPGRLQHTGKNNLLYLRDHVISVNWHAGHGFGRPGRGWGVTVGKRRFDVKYPPDTRVFVPAI